MKLTMLQGAPGAGKTTYALQICAASGDTVRINKDDIRLELLGVTKGTQRDRAEVKRSERELVIPEQERRIRTAFAYNHSVIVDDVNIGGGHEARLRNIAASCNADFEIVPIHATLEECLSRNAARPDGERIPDAAIIRWHGEMTKMYPPTFAQYEHQPGLPWAYICDLDGTAAIMGDRSPYDASRCDEVDDVNKPVRAVLAAMEFMGNSRPLYMSGREEKDREATLRFLRKHNFPSGALYMRTTGDQRKDFIVKGELFDQNIRGKFNVLFCLDDRQQIVDFWRSIGLTCFQVAASFD